MKNPKYYLLIAIAALSQSACSTDNTNSGPEIGGQKISFTIAEDSETRTTLTAGDVMRWVPTDKVGIYTVGKNENSNTLTVADVNQSPVEFIGVLENLVSKGDMFYAYYPYDTAQSTDPTAVNLSIPAAQTQTEAGAYNGQSHPLAAIPTTIAWERDSYAGRISSVRFRLLGAIVELQLYSSNEELRSEKIQSVKFVSETPIAGDFTFNLTTVTDTEVPTISGYELKEVTTTLDEPADVPETKDVAALVYLTIAPGTYTGEFVVTTDRAQYAFRQTEAMTFDRAVIKGLPADLAKATPPVPAEDPITFEDDEVKKICLTAWDTDSNGELSYKEAAAVTSIGTKFMGNESIRSFDELQYFTGLQSIGNSAFDECSSLTSITIPDKVTSIEYRAFCGCESLTSITIPAGVNAIGDAVFQSCSNLESIQLQNGLNSIGDGAFEGCSSLTSINIPQTVTTIGPNVFNGCRSLAAFEGEYASDDRLCLILNGTLLAFARAGLTEPAYTIPNGVNAIGNNAFRGCSNLTSIHIPDGVSTIGDSAFDGCSRLTSINIPDGVTAIGYYAFDSCSSLTSINIPQTVTSIGTQAFYGCSSLSAFYGPNVSDDQRCLILNGKLLAFAEAGLTESAYTIPDKVTKIGNSVFMNCSSLTSINIPAGVTTIETFAFYGCSSLTSVYCKSTTPPTSGDRIFYKTPSFMRIYVPKASVEAYKAAAGWSEYADQIEADDSQPEHDENAPITFTDTAVKEICIAAGWDTNTDGELSYGEAAKVTSLGTNFKENSSIRSFDELQYFTGLKEIGGNAFYNCSSLTSINLPDGLTTIGESAFDGCSSLTSITIPQTVSSIGEFAFSECFSLSAFNGKYASADNRCLILDGVLLAFAPANRTQYTIPNEVTKIGGYAFYGCSSLTSITIPEGVTSIGMYAFHGCSSLTSITIPEGVTEIGYGAFFDCSSLKSITIPDKITITKIQDYTFYGCSSLTSITIPNNVTAIGGNAFRSCSKLTSITIPEGVTSIGGNAFRSCSGLTDVYCKPTEPPILGGNVFDETPSEMIIHVPSGSDGVYQAKWSSYVNQIVEDIN